MPFGGDYLGMEWGAGIRHDFLAKQTKAKASTDKQTEWSKAKSNGKIKSSSPTADRESMRWKLKRRPHTHFVGGDITSEMSH